MRRLTWMFIFRMPLDNQKYFSSSNNLHSMWNKKYTNIHSPKRLLLSMYVKGKFLFVSCLFKRFSIFSRDEYISATNNLYHARNIHK